MAVKFQSLLRSFLPKGLIWDIGDNFKKLLEGMSYEFERLYTRAKTFYYDFNIIQSEKLADVHAHDYLIISGLYSKHEIQRIIVEYLNKEYNFEEVINDWALFLGITIEFGTVYQPFMVGRSTTGNALGDPLINNYRMLLYIKFIDGHDEMSVAKFKWLLAYLKPPYIEILYSQTTALNNIPFYIGRNTTGNPLGIISISDTIWTDENFDSWQDVNLKNWTTK